MKYPQPVGRFWWRWRFCRRRWPLLRRDEKGEGEVNQAWDKETEDHGPKEENRQSIGPSITVRSLTQGQGLISTEVEGIESMKVVPFL